MNCKEAVSWIHEYLDGDLDSGQQQKLNAHLGMCSACRQHFKELEMTEARIRMLVPTEAPDLADRIMGSLPTSQKRQKVFNWLKRHPALVASVFFLLVMFSSVATLWDANEQLTISTSEFDKLIIEGNRVIVPEGQTINGNLVVENGEIVIEGKITGDLVVIDGKYMASTANIAGRITIVNRMFDWLWYKIAGLFGTV